MSGRGLRAGIAACALAMPSIAAVALVRAAPPGPQGTFALDRARSDDVRRAIDSAIAPMSFVLRPVARRRLVKANPVAKTVRIAYQGADVSVQLDGAAPVRAPADGRKVAWKRDDGEVFELSARTEGGALRQTFAGGEGKRVNVYRVEPDGALSLHVTVTHPRLPRPVQYRLVFRRTS